MLQISMHNGIFMPGKISHLYLSILQGNTPFSDWLSQNCPCTEIQASGLSVGLPEGIMENSEFGRQNIADRRDTQRDSGLQYLKQINKFFDKLGIGKIATADSGRWMGIIGEIV